MVKEAVRTLLDEAQDKATALVQGLVEQQRHIFTLNPWYGNAITSFRAGVAIVREVRGPHGGRLAQGWGWELGEWNRNEQTERTVTPQLTRERCRAAELPRFRRAVASGRRLSL